MLPWTMAVVSGTLEGQEVSGTLEGQEVSGTLTLEGQEVLLLAKGGLVPGSVS